MNKERPILFSAPMVRAILDGSKTQTRRVVKPQPVMYEPGMDIGLSDYTADMLVCPYGRFGDRLWIREAFAFTDAHMSKYEGSVEYRADNKCMAIGHGQELLDVPHGCDPRPFAGPWKPSIHMPRWASRILLEIVSVRVERLNDCSEDDARAEGCKWSDGKPGDLGPTELVIDARDEFRRLWESINGTGNWKSNPWVWVVEFKRVNPPSGERHGIS